MAVTYRCFDLSCERTRDHQATHARRGEGGSVVVWGDIPNPLDLLDLRTELESR